MKISYYPGCTLKTKAKNLEKAALASLDALGVEYEELDRWNCCGAVYSLSDDDLIHLVAPVRDLIRVKESGHDTLITLCSMCYNTLARANELMKNDEVKRKTINDFMDEEPDYAGEVRVMHFLDFFREVVGFDKIKEKVTNPLKDLKVAPYYGCTLLRPEEVALDRPDKPEVMHQFLTAIGATVVDFPSQTTCCGSYQVLGNAEATLKVSNDIIQNAISHGAEALAMTCPLCEYNLGTSQKKMAAKFEGTKGLPTFYFTQLLAAALGLDTEILHLELNLDGSAELLKQKNLVKA
ncbi:MAG: CoB--CoM heterodisulfide reductase iron-sulfur subunit B family protein [Candidatus Zixiibacteriota bacterium]